MGKIGGRTCGRRLWFLLVIWISYIVSKVRACPARCQCDLTLNSRTIDCSEKGLKIYPKNISDIVEYLNLSRNLLTELPPDINRLTELQYLNLAHNKLSSLPMNLRGLSNLRELDLSDNAFKNFDDLAGLRHLVHLKTLYLTSNPLHKLDGLKNPSLQFLKADSCGIEKLGNTSLTGFPQLTQLNLANNPLKEIEYPYSVKLEVLDLSKCQLKVLKPYVFQDFPKLTALRLADNPMLVYSTRYETLKHQNLRKIDVSRCELDRPGLHGLPSLTFAKLSGNLIRMLPDRIFAKNRELTHLYLDYNHLEHLNKSVFANLFGLQVLDLSTNGLKSIPTTAFRDNIELQFLNLSDNYLVEFARLSASVVSLDLSSNLINWMSMDSLDSMPKLLSLNLAKNFFREVPNLNSESLRNLILSNNHIWTLDNVSFSGLPAIEKLDLSGNLLTNGIDPVIFLDNPNLQELNLQNNPWNCECSQLYPSYFYLKNRQINTNLLICHNPSNVTGYSWQLACTNEWKDEKIIVAQNRKTYGLILVSLLTLVVLSGMIISIRHTMKLKRQARNHRLEIERAEIRERLRLLQRRNILLNEELRGHVSEPRIHPLELIGPPSYEEAVTMPRLARSLDTLDSVTEIQASNVVAQMTISSESLRAGKKRRPRRSRRLRAQSEDNISRREMRREERLRRAREAEPDIEDNSLSNVVVVESRNKSRPPTPTTAAKRRSKRLSTAKTGSSTDDEDSDAGKNTAGETRKIGKTVLRNLEREPRSGYRPSTDGES